MAREFQPQEIISVKDLKALNDNFQQIKTAIREIHAAIEELKKKTGGQ